MTRAITPFAFFNLSHPSYPSHRSLIAGIVSVLSLTLLIALGAAGDELIVKATNPKPGDYPTLSVSRNADNMVMVAAAFPNVPGFVCESWCYESALDFVDARIIDGGGVELRHRDPRHPECLYVTKVLPEPGAVEFVARPARAHADTENLMGLNMCWQLKKAPMFSSKPEPYPEFIKRCFLFTDAGRVFLDKTVRRRIPCRKPDDAYNNPPWVQSYVGVWCKIPEANAQSWADYSTDRFVVPVIGAVSRDGKYLAALANDTAGGMCQAWHDCMHDNAEWVRQPDGQQVWRVKVYVMANDPAALLARVDKDFPNTRKLVAKRIPPK